MFSVAKGKMASFWYNFYWDDYYNLLNGRVTAAVSLTPIFGYLILFNDYILEDLDFTELVGSDVSTTLFLSSEGRLRLIYFGLILVALARALYVLRMPYVVKQGKNLREYVNLGLENFTVYDFVQLHHRIQNSGHYSVYGKYYTDDWEAFLEDARWKESGNSHGLSPNKKKESRSGIHSIEAKRRHDDLLRSMLIDNYYSGRSIRKYTLATCVIAALTGYLFLLIPSVDLFLRVLQFTFTGQ
ncbi:MAG: hypothetical protein ACU0DI_03255 [Paracoccaceae bacterium]